VVERARDRDDREHSHQRGVSALDRQQVTIAQIATGADTAGIGIVRLSGPRAHAMGRALVGLTQAPPVRRAVLRHAFTEDGETIDQGLYLEFLGPKSMTGEDVAEFQGHGGRVGLSRVLRRCLELGARPAEPGEFSRRAFERGRLDLAQAEGLAAAVGAATEAAHRWAIRQAKGELSLRVKAIVEPLVEAASTLNADVDFPDEHLEDVGPSRVRPALAAALASTQRLLDGYAAGRLLSEGVRVALVGPPNAGKSSLLNALLGRERAIVSPVAGTTRDTIEERLEVFGLLVRLIDTAGIRETVDDIEAQGVSRSLAAMNDADLVIALVSSDTEWLEFVRSLQGAAPAAAVVWVWNKSDVDAAPAALGDLVGRSVAISTKTGDGLDRLRELVRQTVRVDDLGAGLVAIERHAQLLREAEAALATAVRATDAGQPAEIVALDVGISIHRLSAIVGDNLEAEVYADIFKRFCIGK
jgi:tRNA modification GTPase